MRELFEDMFANEPPANPMAAAQRAMRPQLRQRFHERVEIVERDRLFEIALDGRPVRTPARRTLAAPTRALADAIAAEWQAQRDLIDPANMPLTRLANTIIDGVSGAAPEVAAEVAKYLRFDLLFYRAEGPPGLVERQAQAWDPVIAWARADLGARFVLAAGMVFVTQPDTAVAAAQAAIPTDIWKLGAVHAITTLTGSALLALAVLRGRLDADVAWGAAHVDEDWNMDFWGRDTLAMERRAFHFAEMQAACLVLRTVGS
jgi:chaperone required for assembly of F1-ATPase